MMGGVCLKCYFPSKGFWEGCFTFFYLISLKEFQRDLQSCFFISKSLCCLKSLLRDVVQWGLCVGDLLFFKYPWPCCLVFFLGAETTPHLIPANSSSSFLFLFRCHLFLLAEEKSTTRELCQTGRVCPTSPLEERDSELLDWLGSKTNGAVVLMLVNAFSIGNFVI